MEKFLVGEMVNMVNWDWDLSKQNGNQIKFYLMKEIMLGK